MDSQRGLFEFFPELPPGKYVYPRLNRNKCVKLVKSKYIVFVKFVIFVASFVGQYENEAALTEEFLCLLLF